MRWMSMLGAILLSGCASPRFVQVDADSAVVAMPDNSNSWPGYYREKAEKMLQSRYPKGYTIEKEEEFVTGVRTHTTGRTHTEEAPTLMLGGGESRLSKSGGGDVISGVLGAVAIPVGETRQRHEESTSTYNQTEWRMYVRANK